MSKLPCANTMIFKKYPPLKSGPPEISVIQREFRRNEGSTDYATIPEVTLAGDWEFSVDFYRFSDSGGRFIFANYDSVSGSYGLNLYSSGDYSAGAGQLTLFSFSGTPTITGLSKNTFYSVRYKSVGGFVSAYLNGVLFDEGIVLAPAGISSANQAAVWGIPQGSGFRLEGILANLKIYDAGTLIRNYPINDGKNILANAATALGSEIDGLTYALTTAIGGVASVVLTSLSVIGKTYLVVISYIDVIGDAIARIGGFSSPSFTGTGTIEFVATATTTVNDILGALTGVTSGSVTVSIKEAVGYGTIVNGNADDWGLFDRQADGDWLGQELVVISETPLLGDDSDPEFAHTSAVVLSGSEYLISAEFETSGSAGAGCGWSSSGGVPSSAPFRLAAWSVGDKVGGVFESSSAQSPALFGRGGLGLSKYKNVSVKEVLKNA